MERIKKLFSSEDGAEIYSEILKTIDDYNLKDYIEKGVLVGFSGGADSVFLLCFLLEYRSRTFDFPILAVHINHLIRGEDAFSDETFSRDFCNELKVEFLSSRIDIPLLSKKENLGIEECARKYRYLEFEKIIFSRTDISSIAVAHNADDNLETMLMNMFRGCGTRGMSGIPVHRENIIRPIIRINKSDIVRILKDNSIDFVFDKTNNDNSYKRNYIRNEIIPAISRLADNPQKVATKISRNLRDDDDYITGVAINFLGERKTVHRKELLQLHRAVLARVVSIFSDTDLSFVNVNEIRKLLDKDNFSYSLPGNKRFICEYGLCRIELNSNCKEIDFHLPVSLGCNEFAEFHSFAYLSDKYDFKDFKNIYKKSIYADLSSAILVGELYFRPKQDGDTIFYGGITHKLKKLYNDKKIPPVLRRNIPVLCDDKGVVWVPGFGVRDDYNGSFEKNKLFIFLGTCTEENFSNDRFYLGNEFKT